MKRTAFFLVCFFMGATLAFAQNKPVISFDKTLHDFGEVLESNGDISYEFVAKNTGNAPLVLNRVTASCGCTTPNWTKEPIEPGKTGIIKVTYGAKGRPGPFSKTISVYSNADDKPYVLTIKGSVKATPADPTVSYPIAVGNLLLKSDVLNLGNVKNTEVRSTVIEVYNNGNAPITPVFEDKASYMTLKAEPATIAPNSKGIINIALDGKAAKTYGTVENKFLVGYSGNFNSKGITIAATFVDDFNAMTAEEKAQAPVLKVEQSSIDFGNVSAKGFKKTQQLTLVNEGKSKLIIRNIKSSSGLYTISKGKKELKPGEKVNYNVVLTGKVTGNVSNSIEIISNDPVRSVYRILVLATNQ